MLTEVGERDDLLALGVDLVGREAEQRGGQVDVRLAAVVGMETGAELEQRADAAVHAHGAARGLDDAGHDLQQRRLAGAVLADDAERFAARELERYAIERAKDV